MASSVKHFCTVCHDDGISNKAVTWCTECEVLFCEDCKKPHSMSRLFKNHKTMSSENYQKLPRFMQEISSRCRDHKKMFELYCSFHACPCCVQCITDEHQKCKDFKPFSDIIKKVKSSALVQLLENDIKDVKENLDTAIKYMKNRISTINTQKTKSVEEIRYMRKSYNDYLNKLEQDILNDLDSKHSKLELDISTLVQQIEQRASQISEMQSQFNKMKQYATELQMYIGLREIEKTTSQIAKYIEDLDSGDCLIDQNLDVILSSALQSILHDVKSFGEININTTSSTFEIKTGRKDQAQVIIPTIPQIAQIKPSLLTRLNIPTDIKTLDILACRILPDGKFILLDYYANQLLLFGNDGIFIRIIVTFKIDPCDACFVRNNSIAVALGAANQTKMVDIQKNKIIQTIKLSHYCYAVASDGETLVISSGQSKCTRVNLNDMSHTIREGMKKVHRIALFQGNIYGTLPSENKVCCYDSTGELLWIFQHRDIDYPFGIALDINGNVYIDSSGNDSIVVISPDGKTCKTILSEPDGIKFPRRIDINREREMMIVSGELSKDSFDTILDTAFIYKI